MRFGRCPKCGLVLQEGQFKCPRCFADISWDREDGPVLNSENERGEKEPEN